MKTTCSRKRKQTLPQWRHREYPNQYDILVEAVIMCGLLVLVAIPLHMDIHVYASQFCVDPSQLFSQLVFTLVVCKRSSSTSIHHAEAERFRQLLVHRDNFRSSETDGLSTVCFW